MNEGWASVSKGALLNNKKLLPVIDDLIMTEAFLFN